MKEKSYSFEPGARSEVKTVKLWNPVGAEEGLPNLGPFVPFPDLWESEGKWPKGRLILSEVVDWLRGRALVASEDVAQRGAIGIRLPLPLLNRGGNVIGDIPFPLRDRFIRQCVAIAYIRSKSAIQICQPYMSQEISPEIMATINDGLRRVELDVAAARDIELWQVAAHYFGLDWSNLPEIKGIFYRGKKAQQHT